MEKKKYGFFITLAFMVSMVIGVGIFFKGQTIIDLTESAWTATLAWTIVSIAAIFLALSYIEVSSSTIQTDKPEQGTLAKWGSKFVNRGFGRWMGMFAAYVYIPLNLIALSLISSRLFLNMLIGAGVFDSTIEISHSTQLNFGLLIGIIAVFIILILAFINSFTMGFSRKFQTMGIILKVGVLAIIVISIFVFLILGNYNNSYNQIPAFPSDHSYSNPSAAGFFLAFPSIMFAFDGFIYAGSLQSETKNKKVFQRALMTGVILVTTLYAFVIVGSFMIGEPGSGFDVPGILTTIFSDSIWLQTLLLLIIVLSGLTSFNSYFIFGTRMDADNAQSSYVMDYDGLTGKQSPSGSFLKATWIQAGIIIGYLGVFFIADVIFFPYYEGSTSLTLADVTTSGFVAPAGYVSAMDYFGNIAIICADIVVMIMYVHYAIIIVAAIHNRKTNKVKVNKQKGFVTYGIIASSIIFFIVTMYFISVILGYAQVGSLALNGDGSTFGSFYAPMFDVLFFVILIAIYLAMQKPVNKKYQASLKEEDNLFENHEQNTINETIKTEKNIKPNQTIDLSSTNKSIRLKQETKIMQC